MKTFTLKSEELGGQFTTDNFYNDWGANGKNISPQLSWENPPAGTESFALTIYDLRHQQVADGGTV